MKLETKTYIVLERDEISRVLNYRLIAECVGSYSWVNGKIKREKERTFTPSEMSMITNIYRKAHQWYLVTGVPDKVTMTLTEFSLWNKLKDFCVKNMTLYGKERYNA